MVQDIEEVVLVSNWVDLNGEEWSAIFEAFKLEMCPSR